MSPRPDRKQRENIAIGAIFVALCAGLLSIGGVYAWGVYVALVASTLGLFFFSIDRFRRHGSIRIQWPFWTTVFLAIISLVQAIPLPTGVMHALSPIIYSKMQAVYALAGLSFDVHSIALNAPSALFSVNKYLAAGFIFLLTMNLSHKSARGIKLATLLVIMGVALMLIALFGLVLTPGTVLGVYKPSALNRPWIVSLLICPNNLSAVLNLTGFTAMGLYARSRRKTGYLVASIILELGAFMTLSRAGMAGAVVGIVLFLIMGASGFRRKLSAWILVPVLLAAFFVFVLAFDRSTTEIGTGMGLVKSAHGRLALALSGLHAFMYAPFTGIGQMGFADFYRLFGGPHQWATFFFIENEPVQYLADFGVFGLLAMAIFITWFVHTLLIAKKDGPTTGLSIGLIVLFLQGLVDFNPEMPGVLFMMSVALGTLYGLGTHGSSKREGRFFRSWRSGRSLVLAMVLSGLVTGSILFVAGPRRMVDPAPDIDKSTGMQAYIMSRLPTGLFSVVDPVSSLPILMSSRMAVSTMAGSLIVGRLKDVIGKTSLNPRPYAGAASAFMASGNTGDAIRLARAARFLAPHSVKYRLFLMDIMASAHRFKMAAKQAETLLSDKKSMNKLIDFLALTPGGLKTAAYLGNNYKFAKDFMGFMRYRVKDGRERFCRLVLAEFPKNCVCRGFSIRHSVNKDSDLKKADFAATMLLGECPDEPDGYLALGHVMLLRGKKLEAYYMLLEARKKLGGQLSFEDLLTMAALQIDLGNLDEAQKTIARARRKGRQYKWVNVRAKLLESRISLKKGKIAKALLQLEYAVNEAPGDVDVLNSVMKVYIEIGALRKAMSIAKQLYKLTGDERYKQRDTAIRRQIQMKILQEKQ